MDNPSTNYTINSLLLDAAQLGQFKTLLLSRDYWGEHDLLKETFSQLMLELPNFDDLLSLFQGHFVLYNALYRLINSPELSVRIVIEVTRIQIFTLDDMSNIKPTNQKLMAYYLDEENLIGASRAMIQEMLENWRVEFAQHLSDEQTALAIAQRWNKLLLREK